MRFTSFAAVLIVAATASSVAAAESDFAADPVTVGRNLQAYASIRLSKPVSQSGLEITITSDDPSRLVLAKAADQPGSPAISLKIPGQAARTPEFAIRGLASSGSVSYTISALGLESAKGVVTLAPSAIVIVGPHQAPRFPTTPRADSGILTLLSVVLDSAGKVLGQQDVAGGSKLEVEISNSNPAAVKLAASKITMAGGSDSAVSGFHPVAEGDAVIAPVQPSGFTAPTERASITVAVATPGLAIAGDFYIGKDLQTSASVVLGEPAPPGGLSVTLKSSDSSRLILSGKADEVGSGSLTISIPGGQRTGPYFLQALGDSGEVEYTATAPGYHGRTESIGLAASGMIIAYEAYGPPDEANVKRKIGLHSEREFFVSMADAKVHPVRLVVYSAYIDKETGRSADFTVQPLRGGVTAAVVVKSSNPSVATVESPLTVKPGFNRAICLFTPLMPGKTLVSLDTPAGFSAAQNAVSVPAIVKE